MFGWKTGLNLSKDLFFLFLLFTLFWAIKRIDFPAYATKLDLQNLTFSLNLIFVTKKKSLARPRLMLAPIFPRFLWSGDQQPFSSRMSDHSE